MIIIRQYSRKMYIILLASRHIRCVKCLESGVRAHADNIRKIIIFIIILLCRRSRSRVNEVVGRPLAGRVAVFSSF